MSELTYMLQTFGLSVTLLFLAGLAGWRILLWLRPWIEQAITAHIHLVSTATAAIQQLSDTQRQLSESLVHIADRLDRIETAISRDRAS